MIQAVVDAQTVTDFSYPLYWGRSTGSIGDFDGDGYRDYLIRSWNHAFLYRGGDRHERRDTSADAIVLNPTGNAAIADITEA